MTRLATLVLLVVTAVWGSTFYLTRDLVQTVPAPDYLGVRFAIAALVNVLAIPRLGLYGALVGLAVAALLASSSGPSWARTFFSEGLIIVGWIALWHPVDMLFFERLPLLREQRVLRRIQNADVRVL